MLKPWNVRRKAVYRIVALNADSRKTVFRILLSVSFPYMARIGTAIRLLSSFFFIIILLIPFFILIIILFTHSDGVVGEVLIYAIRQTVGPDAFNPTVHIAWVKIYSRMLKTMVPVAVAHELKDSSAQQKRFITNSIGFQSQDFITGLTGSGGGNSTSGKA